MCATVLCMLLQPSSVCSHLFDTNNSDLWVTTLGSLTFTSSIIEIRLGFKKKRIINCVLPFKEQLWWGSRHGFFLVASSVGNTALTYACCGGYEDVVKILLESAADVEHQNENGHTPLMEAASCGHVGK